jgi:glyoxylase-like metal-dependent hydrolase (beta-lactamase superfamily II)
MHLLSGGRLLSPQRFYYAEAEKGSRMELPVSCGLIKHSQGNVLFDTGCHPDAPADGGKRWGDIARNATPIYEASDAVVNQLPKAGLTAVDIDVVVCSHLHMDHCGCNTFFPRAVVICHAREMEIAQASDAEAGAYLRAEWDHGGEFKTIEAEHDLFGDGRVTLIPMPGHTPGSIVAHVVTDRDGAFVLTGDAAPLRDSFERRTVPVINLDGDLTLKSYEDMARLQKNGATLVFSHDDAQWRALRTGEAFYE